MDVLDLLQQHWTKLFFASSLGSIAYGEWTKDKAERMGTAFMARQVAQLAVFLLVTQRLEAFFSHHLHRLLNRLCASARLKQAIVQKGLTSRKQSATHSSSWRTWSGKKASCSQGCANAKTAPFPYIAKTLIECINDWWRSLYTC